MSADLLGEEIAILRETIRANDGSNVANRAFVRKVDELITAFYDDIGEFTALSLTDILDLFLIKVLYVNRASRDAGTLEYLSDLLGRYLLTSSMDLGQGIVPYMTDFMVKTAETRGDETFEVARKYGDNALSECSRRASGGSAAAGEWAAPRSWTGSTSSRWGRSTTRWPRGRRWPAW